MPNIPSCTLNDSVVMPRVGLGLWKVGDEEAAEIVRQGVAAGYRLLDTAAMYKNEKGVGMGIASAGVPRRELFITTKLWNSRHGYDETLRAFDESMVLLGLDYLDLYLIHWPVAGSEKYLDSWRALIRLRDEGRVRSIGVSNFLELHINRLVDATGVTPSVNQIEYHPLFQQPALAAFNAKLGIRTECWAPLGRGAALDAPAIAAIAGKYGKSPAQVVLRWHFDHGFIIIPKSANPDRMRQNLDIFDFSLEPNEMAALNALHAGQRTGGDPMTFTGLDL